LVRDDCPCVEQPAQCYSVNDFDFQTKFPQCWASLTWAINTCVGNPNCDHQLHGAGGYYGHDGKELSKDSPRVLFQWYLANRPDRDCKSGSIDIQGCPQPCQVDLDAAVDHSPPTTLAPAPSPMGHEYPMSVGCDPSYVNKTHPYYALYTANGGDFNGALVRDDCPCVEQPAQCYSVNDFDFQTKFPQCWASLTWAINTCVGNPNCDHQLHGAGGYYGHDGKELSKDSPRVLFQWYLANRPDRDCKSGSIDIQGCPQPCQVDLDAAVMDPSRRLRGVFV